jgi:hypothetical protein
MNKYVTWILVAAILALGGFAYYNHRQHTKTLLKLRQELKSGQDSTYGVIADLKSTNSALSEQIRAVSELIITLKTDSSVGSTDTIYMVNQTVHTKFSGENYLFRYNGEVEIDPNNEGRHKLHFIPKSIALTQTLLQDPDGNWYSLVRSNNPNIGISSRFLIDKSLLFNTNKEIIKPKNFSVMPFVYIRKEWDTNRISFDAGIRATFYSSYLNLSAREIGIGTYLKFLKF